MRVLLAAVLLAGAAAPALAQAQEVVAVRTLAGTRVDVSAVGTVSRVPDLAIISAGVVTRAATATAAIEQNAARMERVRAALRRAGIADKDIQTSAISLNPDYAYVERQPPRLTGYNASNTLSVRFRDIRATGQILDALVKEGANQISGPNLTIDKPEAAYDEARVKAIAVGRARAELYARALGMRVVRVLSVSESGGYAVPPPMPVMMDARAESGMAKTVIEPGSQDIQATVAMSFELQ